MHEPLATLLNRFIERSGQSVSRVSSQSKIPKQTLFNWVQGRTPRWHPQLPADLAGLARSLGLNSQETDQLLLAAGCVCAVDTPHFEKTTMSNLTLPRGWFRAGSHPDQYEIGLDSELKWEEHNSSLIRARESTAEGFGCFMQTCSPDDFLGKRVRLSAMARTEAVEQWAGLWFRVDALDLKQSLQFDNMQNRPLKGSTEWQRYAVVLDVPQQAGRLAYGVLLSGAGSTWIADVRIEEVSDDIPSTNLDMNSNPRSPTNLDFSE